MIRDLFPSYIDELTGDTTNQLIEEHVADCKECTEILKAMKTPESEPVGTKGSEKKEIDFLKKIRKQHTAIIVGSLAVAAVLIGAVLAVRAFVVGDYLYGDWLACHVIVNGNQVIIEGTSMDSVHGVSQVTFQEVEGTVIASTKAVLTTPFNKDKNTFRAEYTASTQEVKQVRINDRILWDDNYEITAMASAVYLTRHEYVGDMSANNRTANALNVAGYLGSYTNELLTSEEPYTWKLILSEDIPAEKRLQKESYMESIACIMMAVIDNLEQVTYEYTVDGQALTKNFNMENAEFFYGNVKCIDSVRGLDELISYTGLSVSKSYDDSSSTNRENADTLEINEIIETETPLKGLLYTLYQDGEVLDESYYYGDPDLGPGGYRRIWPESIERHGRPDGSYTGNSLYRRGHQRKEAQNQGQSEHSDGVRQRYHRENQRQHSQGLQGRGSRNALFSRRLCNPRENGGKRGIKRLWQFVNGNNKIMWKKQPPAKLAFRRGL